MAMQPAGHSQRVGVTWPLLLLLLPPHCLSALAAVTPPTPPTPASAAVVPAACRESILELHRHLPGSEVRLGHTLGPALF